MVRPNNDKEDMMDKQAEAMTSLFLPEVLRQLRAQYPRYLKIEEHDSKNDKPLSFIEFINMVLVIGINTNIGILVRREKELGL